MKEILAKIEEKTAQAKAFLAEGENKDVQKATGLLDEVDALKAEYEAEKRLYEAEKQNNTPNDGELEAQKQAQKTMDHTAEFAKAVRDIISGKGLVEGVDAQGGYTVPEDIQTTINHWADVEYSLLQDIDVVPVTTTKGARTYQKKSEADIFMDTDENGAITKEIPAPQFERITYSIQNRTGFMPVSNDLIADSDANIVQIVSDWLGKANVATSNAKILEIIKKKSPVAIKGINDIKKAINVTLGQAYKSGAKIITNDDGLNYLDTLEDKNGRPLLNPDPTNSANLQLRCGTVVVPIRVLPNKVLATTGTKIPFIIGDLKSGIRKYDRQSISIMSSNVATIGTFNAFAMNMTVFRAILRDDYKELDKDSYVLAELDTATAGE